MPLGAKAGQLVGQAYRTHAILYGGFTLGKIVFATHHSPKVDHDSPLFPVPVLSSASAVATAAGPTLRLRLLRARRRRSTNCGAGSRKLTNIAHMFSNSCS